MQPTPHEAPSPGKTPKGRYVGFGCGCLGLLMMGSGALVFVLLATRILKKMFHLRLKEAEALAVLSLADIGAGFFALVIGVVLVVLFRKKGA